MAVLCALALAFALLLPRTQAPAGAHTGARAGAAGGTGVAEGRQTRAEKCTDDNAQDLTPAPSGADGAVVDAIKSRTGAKRKLIVGVDQNSYRWGYRNPNSAGAELEGFDIDLAHRIARDVLGDPDAVQFKAIPTSQRISALQEGRVDLVVRTMTINCDRLGQVAFSAPYFRTGQQLLAPRSAAVTGYNAASLDGRRICVASGSTAYAKLKGDLDAGRLPGGTTAVTVPNQLDCLVRLQLGEADVVITDGALAASQAAQDPTLELKGDAFTTEFYGVAMRRGATDLVRRVNRVLADYRDNGWQASYDKWLSATLGEDSGPSKPPAPKYLGAAG
ncbi:glutamate ABC transporter substrate-binding protein [Streptomyces sp. J2-1]|nr:glutamate ABC transporter substrate-binding protein [Streptomyces corallincola]